MIDTDEKVVLVWGSADILSSSIENSLSTRTTWKVISISEDDLEVIRSTVEALHPNIVITIHKDSENYLSNRHMQLLQQHSEIKLIMINLNNNLMEIYDKQQILVKNSTDLFSVIENEV